MRCTICGAKIKPWFEVCYGCCNPTLSSMDIPEPIIAKDFMQNMGINSWK
ncbi:hypothetical protein HYV80_02560 [Candidatus Woesearchaeota archaeon]|nr:hypothetical protein [Candidatus Woesearchaeota archaeon]